MISNVLESHFDIDISIYYRAIIYRFLSVPAADEAAACTGRNAAPAAV